MVEEVQVWLMKTVSVCITNKWQKINRAGIQLQMTQARSHSFVPAMIKGVFYCCLLTVLASEASLLRLKVTINWMQLLIDVVTFKAQKAAIGSSYALDPFVAFPCYSFPLPLGSSVLLSSLHAAALILKNTHYVPFPTQESSLLWPRLLLRQHSNTWTSIRRLTYNRTIVLESDFGLEGERDNMKMKRVSVNLSEVRSAIAHWTPNDPQLLQMD